jgi:catechol 2,3-dioxygenase-like lactoylglutathione lyase family enzyme
MEVRGLVFAGTATKERAATSSFLRDVLGLSPVPLAGVDIDLFALPDGTAFAVAPAGSMGETRRTIGFRVDDLEAAIAELHAAGVETDGIGENSRWRYTHFRLPDGELYELVEERAR